LFAPATGVSWYSVAANVKANANEGRGFVIWTQRSAVGFLLVYTLRTPMIVARSLAANDAIS